MPKIFKFVISLTVALFLISNIAPSIVYAAELSKYTENLDLSKDIDRKLSKPLEISEEQLDNLIEERRNLYSDLTEEEMKNIAYKVMSPYSTRDSIWDGKGVTLSEFAWAFDIVIGGLISGYATLGKYAAKHGVAAARSLLSRAARAAAQRVGVLSGFIAGVISAAVSVVNIYYNIGYAIAQFIDARDYYRNNGRINAWA